MVSNNMPCRDDHDMKAKFEAFATEHRDGLSNPVVQRFLEYDTYYQIFIEAVCFPTKQRWQRLNRAFQNFYMEIRLIDYISKTLWRYAKDFRAKNDRSRSHYLLILDQPLSEEDGSTGVTYKDQLVSENYEWVRENQTLLEGVNHHGLHHHLKRLTHRQLEILDLYYFYGLTQKEISQYLGVSQQLISKTANRALDHLRALLERGECDESK